MYQMTPHSFRELPCYITGGFPTRFNSCREKVQYAPHFLYDAFRTEYNMGFLGPEFHFTEIRVYNMIIHHFCKAKFSITKTHTVLHENFRANTVHLMPHRLNNYPYLLNPAHHNTPSSSGHTNCQTLPIYQCQN